MDRASLRRALVALASGGLLLAGVACSTTPKANAGAPQSPTASASPSPSVAALASWYPDAVLTTKPTAATGKPQTIHATDRLTFDPDIVYVKVGTKVTWEVALGTVPHNVTFVNGSPFEANLNAATPTASRVFDTAGTYRYVCKIHTNMAGEIVVKA